MVYKTCENCGCKVYSHGCVNCDEMEYISMQEGYQEKHEPSLKTKENPQKYVVRCVLYTGALNEAHAKCKQCGKEEWQHKL